MVWCINDRPRWWWWRQWPPLARQPDHEHMNTVIIPWGDDMHSTETIWPGTHFTIVRSNCISFAEKMWMFSLRTTQQCPRKINQHWRWQSNQLRYMLCASTDIFEIVICVSVELLRVIDSTDYQPPSLPPVIAFGNTCLMGKCVQLKCTSS